MCITNTVVQTSAQFNLVVWFGFLFSFLWVLVFLMVANGCWLFG
jgi:hypothetical protein